MPPKRDRLRRRAARLDPRPRILVVCEGEKTEPAYLGEIGREEEVRLIEIVIVRAAGVPKTLVERAAKMKRDSEQEAARHRDTLLRYDEVWCVFDVDDHPMLNEARQQARDNGIRLAISNPCFELWLVLHFQDQHAHIHRKDVQRTCRSHMRDYHKTARYADLKPNYREAVERASKLDERHARDNQPGTNPSTSVYTLTERLRGLGRDAQLQRLQR